MSNESVMRQTHMRALAALGTFTILGTFIVTWPHPVAPRELPWLLLSQNATRAVIEQDEARATHAPDTQATKNLTALIREKNAAEVSGEETPQEVLMRTTNLTALRSDVERESGVDGVLALRAKAVVEMDRFVASHPNENPPALFGSFPQVMEHYDVTKNGVLRAPAFVLRVLFKSRWNTVVGLSPVWRLEPVEKQAYFGWLAIGADQAAPADRQRGLAAYAQAGGLYVEEIDGVLAWQAQEYERAGESFRRALESGFSYRVRNYEIAANRAVISRP